MTRHALCIILPLLAYAALLDDATARRYCLQQHSPQTCNHMLTR